MFTKEFCWSSYAKSDWLVISQSLFALNYAMDDDVLLS